MSLVCLVLGHVWREWERFEVPPQPNCSAFSSATYERQNAIGYTIVRERCQRCSASRNVRVPGHPMLGRTEDEVANLLKGKQRSCGRSTSDSARRWTM